MDRHLKQGKIVLDISMSLDGYIAGAKLYFKPYFFLRDQKFILLLLTSNK